MPSESEYICPLCGMGFNSSVLLHKHKTRFCVGSRPDSGESSRMIPASRNYSPLSDGGIVKLDELQHLKERRAQDRLAREKKERQLAERTPLPDIHTQDETNPRRGPIWHSRQNHLQQQMAAHSKTLAELQTKNKHLHSQKEDIDRRLEALGGGIVSPTAASYNLLEELKDMEAKNQHTLEQLRRQLTDLTLTKRPISPGNSLAAEISAMRQSYLRQGGRSTAILAQITEMEAEASRMEDKHRNNTKPTKGHESLRDQFSAIEKENQYLQDELLYLQEKNNDNLLHRKWKHEDKDVWRREMQTQQQEHMRRLGELQHEMDYLRQQVRLERYKRELQPAPYQPHPMQPPLQPPPDPQGQRPTGPLEVPALTTRGAADVDPLLPSPYDPHSGFTVYYDFLMGLEASVQSCRLLVALHNSQSSLSDMTPLPVTHCEPHTTGDYYQQGYNKAIIRAQQPVPKCKPSSDLGLVLELQVNHGGHDNHMATKAWCKVDLFDKRLCLLSGRWKIPLRLLPVQASLSTGHLNTIPQYGNSEVHIRLVNQRDAAAQSAQSLSALDTHLYRYPPQSDLDPLSHLGDIVPAPDVLRRDLDSDVRLIDKLNIMHHATESALEHTANPSALYKTRLKAEASVPMHGFDPSIPPPPSVSPPPSPHYRENQESGLTMGFQVDRLKYAERGFAKVRLTAYYKDNGRVVLSDTSAVTCSTTSEPSNFKFQYHIFGRQEASFKNIYLRSDMILVARVYILGKHGNTGEEKLVAWCALPLTVSLHDEHALATSERHINVGSHFMRLYEPPVPEVRDIPIEEHWRPKDWQRYRQRATLRVYVFQGEPRPGSLTPSEASDDDIDLPKQAWIQYARTNPPSSPYNSQDGFDMYIDGCKNLPDSVTISKVAGRILSRKYERIGKDINTGVNIHSDIYNPQYEQRTEYRQPNMPPTSTLLIKVYTVDRFYKKLAVVGYATLNIFVETGTEKQPTADVPGIQISLNEGAHQLRLYSRGPIADKPLTESCLREAGIRVVPCATVLVRLFKAPIGPQGRLLQSDKVPRSDWHKYGLWMPMPSYGDRVYQSMTCEPIPGEVAIFDPHMRRAEVPISEAVHIIADSSDKKFLKTDRSIENFVKTQLTRMMDENPMDFDLTYVTKYSPKHGIKVSVDSAMNIPWSGFTFATFSLNPPGAFYKGQPHAAFDQPVFTSVLESHSTNKSPVWMDGLHHYHHREYHRFLTLIVHVQEISVTVTTDSYKYGLVDQAWSAVQVFSDGYAHTSAFQLPLYQGAPSTNMLDQLSREPCQIWLERNTNNGIIKLADNASVYVRLADGRRDWELPGYLSPEQKIEVNVDYLPSHKIESFQSEKKGTPLSALVPAGKDEQDFVHKLATKFKSLVYKVYEEGKLGQR